MKGKVLESQYNPGYDSWVLKATKYGTFDGHVFLHELDEDIDNSFDGCRIAEFDCNLKAYKEKAKWMRQRAIGSKNIYNNVMNSLIDEEIEWTDDIKHVCDKFLDQTKYMFYEADKARDYYERMKDYRPIFIKNLLTKRREARKRYKDKY